MLAILAEPEFATLKADFHSFAGGRGMAEIVVAHGCMLGMSGMVTFPKADNVREVIAGTPRDRFLVETDTPYLAPVPYRGKPNEPSYTVEIATRLGLESSASTSTLPPRDDGELLPLLLEGRS